MLVGLYILALVVRIGAGLALGIDKPINDDEPEYYHPAANLASGKGYCMVPQQAQDQVARPTAYRMPGAAIVLAVVFQVFGESVRVARLTSIVVSSFSAPLMYLVARRVAPAPAPLLAACGCALYPTWVFNSFTILSEPYFIPGLLLALLTTFRAIHRRSATSAAVAGLTWGALTLIRPHGLPMAMLLFLYFGCTSGWRAGFSLLLGALVVLAPWVVRNAVVMGHPILLATEGGETMLGANNRYVFDEPRLHGMWIAPMSVDEYRERLRSVQGEIERDHQQRDLALGYVRSYPTHVPLLAVRKLWRWLTPVTQSRGAVRFLVLGSYGSLLALVLIGAVRRLFPLSAELQIVLLWTLLLAIVTAVYWGNLTRGRLPLEMAWLPWGAWSAANLVGLTKASPASIQ